MTLTCPHCGKLEATLGHILGHGTSEAKTKSCRENAKRPRPNARKRRVHRKKVIKPTFIVWEHREKSSSGTAPMTMAEARRLLKQEQARILTPAGTLPEWPKYEIRAVGDTRPVKKSNWTPVGTFPLEPDPNLER